MTNEEYVEMVTRGRMAGTLPWLAIGLFLIGVLLYAFFLPSMGLTIDAQRGDITDIRNAGMLVEAARGGPFPDRYEELDAEVEMFSYWMSHGPEYAHHNVTVRVAVGNESGRLGIALFSGAHDEAECAGSGRGSWPCGGPPLAYHHDLYAVGCGGTGDVAVGPGDVVTMYRCFALPAHMGADAAALVMHDSASCTIGNCDYSPHRVMPVDLKAASPVPYLACVRTDGGVVCG